MKISLVICTYMRPESILKLLDSVNTQLYKPFEIIIVDGSTNEHTQETLKNFHTDIPLRYFLVDAEIRGLTKQRNFGVSKVSSESEIIAFLDDDVVLYSIYFQEIAKTFQENPEAAGVGGIDVKENGYFRLEPGQQVSGFHYYTFDGYATKEDLRFKIRKFLGLITDLPPAIIPPYSHGRSGHPPSGKTYEVEHLIGLSMAFRKYIFQKIRFSTYFEGYGLYEDFDFSVRSLVFGKLYVNTKALLEHFHDPFGRPNYYKYGQMVVKNGWYVWKLKFPKTSILNTAKWHLTSLLLAHIRLFSVLKGPNRRDGFQDYTGRLKAWIMLLIKKPQHFL